MLMQILSHIQWPDILSDPMVDFDETIGTQSIKAICNSSRISYGYCETICSGAATVSSLTCLVLHSPLIG